MSQSKYLVFYLHDLRKLKKNHRKVTCMHNSWRAEKRSHCFNGIFFSSCYRFKTFDFTNNVK